MKLIVGLGNPGLSYKKTRHNVGFIILDSFGFKWQKKDNYEYYIGQNGTEKIIFLKPLTFMNLSGDAVKKVVNFYKIEKENILIIHDDMDYKIGDYKIKYSKTGGHHNGIKSVIQNVGENIPTLKIGIGRNNDLIEKDYVLGKLSKEEIEVLKSSKYRDIINYFIKNGIDKTMNIYNRKG